MKNCDKIYDLLSTDSTLVAEHTEIFQVPFPSSDFSGFQGGCSDGERYYYVVLMHYELSDRTKDYSCIAKIDLKENKVVKYSGVLHLDHGNDVTYNPKRKLLMVANNRPHPTKITLIDPESLEIVGYEEAPIPIYAIEYVPERDTYAVGISGTRDFCLLDSDLKRIDGTQYGTAEFTHRYTKQGLCADNNFIYFILWDGKHARMEDFQNVVSIYDWNGNYRGVLEFNIGVKEPENLSIVNGEILAVCGKREAIIYHFEPRIKEPSKEEK